MAEERPRFDFTFTQLEERKPTRALASSYWVYHIAVRTTFKRYAQENFTVVRRYSDFDWLRTRLSELFPFVIIPPLPPKDLRSAIPGALSTVTLEYRQRALRKFLSRVGAHPVLQKSELLQVFLEKPEAEWANAMQAPKETLPLPRLLSKFAAGAPEDPAADAAAPPMDARAWAECEQYVLGLRAGFLSLKDQCSILAQRRAEAGYHVESFGTAFDRVADFEARQDGEGTGSTPLSRAVHATAQHAKEMATLYKEQADREMRQVAEAMQYYMGMCDAAHEALQRVQQFAKKRDALSADVEEKSQAAQRMTARGGVAPEKVMAAEAELRDKQQQLADMKAAVARLERLFREEFRGFHRDKQYDVKSMLRSFVDLQHDYADKMKSSWEALAPTVEAARV
jgi:sorting nexin-1/2